MCRVNSQKSNVVDQPSSGSCKVLLVEDNEINQALILAILQNKGFEVTVAENGKIALDILKDCEFNLILMDIQMPVMDGMEAAQNIRQLKNGKEVPIIALTASMMKGEHGRCIQSGMNGYVEKPLSQSSLFREIDRVTKMISRD